MPDFAPRLPSRRTVFRTLAIGTMLIAVTVVLLAVLAYMEAVRTFEVRRVSLPTRIYTDRTPLQPGAPLGAEVLEEKLRRLGYREGEDISSQGTFRKADGAFEIHLRPFEHPEGDHGAQVVRVTTSGGEIESVDSPGGGSATVAALEPELLTSMMGEQLENRSPVQLEAIPPVVRDAVIVTEDARFFQHPGVDPLGIFRALWRNIRSGDTVEGGSTLTQQLVKNYYLTNERTLRRKVVEAFMALILDAKYSKEEILEAYLNDIYLGRNRSISILGVGQASRFYFGKPVSEVTAGEAALLAGMIPSPNNYSPFDNPEQAKRRRDHVLAQMRKRDKITEEQYRAALAEPLPERPYREQTALASIPFYVDRVIQEVRRDYGIDEVAGRGLNIYTAVDLQWQAAATRALRSGLERLEKSSSRLRNHEVPLEGAIIGIDVESGEIRALVGGRDYERSQFNRATSARRQVGSLFKPFVLLAAFEPSLSQQNITPATLVNDSRFVLERRFAKDWSPRNYEGHYYGVVTVRQALEKSMNSASVRLGLSAGVDSIIRTAHALGIESELESHPSLILGAVEVPPIEMAEAFNTMARMGSRVPLRSIRFVTDGDGDLLAATEVESVQVFPARDVYLAVHLMEGVMNRGTGAGARSLGFRRTAAGKTGTTNDKRDSWFIGFTPQTLGLTWIGFDDNAPVGLSGSEGAVPIWARFMNEITEERAEADFPVPAGIVFVETDVATGGLATPQCPRNQVLQEAFKIGTEPRQPCPIHELREEFLVDAYGRPILGPDGYPLTTTSPMLPGGIGDPLGEMGTTTGMPERPDPVLRGGSFPTSTGAPPPSTTTPTTTNPPQRLPVELPREGEGRPPVVTPPTATRPEPPPQPPPTTTIIPPTTQPPPEEPPEDPPPTSTQPEEGEGEGESSRSAALLAGTRSRLMES